MIVFQTSDTTFIQPTDRSPDDIPFGEDGAILARYLGAERMDARPDFTGIGTSDPDISQVK